MGAQCCETKRDLTPAIRAGLPTQPAEPPISSSDKEGLCEEATANAVTVFANHAPMATGRTTHRKSECLNSRRETEDFLQFASAALLPIPSSHREPATAASGINAEEERKHNSGKHLGSFTFKTEAESTLNRSGPTVVIDMAGFKCERREAVDARYESLYVMGKGGFGEVLKIRDKDTHEIRALKVIRKVDCKKTDNFRDEIDILKKLVRVGM